MRALVQRVTRASVSVEGKVRGEIGPGLLVLLGATHVDDIGAAQWLADKVAGIAVHTGARVAALANPGEVFVSSTVRDLVSGSGIAFESRGEHELKGIGERQVFAVVDRP